MTTLWAIFAALAVLVTAQNAEAYGRFVGGRFRQHGNIVWILGGDRAAPTDASRAIWRALRAREGANVNDTANPAAGRPLLIVLTDIGGDPHDQQSMVRLMTFSNEFEIEGLIAGASGTSGCSTRPATTGTSSSHGSPWSG